MVKIWLLATRDWQLVSATLLKLCLKANEQPQLFCP
jgi:hypothetical protein